MLFRSGGNGSIIAGTGNVSLNASQGNVTLNAVANQISGNVLTLRALNTSNVNTAVRTLTANITGSGQDLTVNEGDDLAIGANGVTSNGGNVTLTTAGAITGGGTVAANALNITVGGNSTINTSVNSVSFAVTKTGATLAIYEDNGLNISGNQITGNGTTVVSVANGTLNVAGTITAPNASLTLNVPNGSLALSNIVTLNQLDITAANLSPLATNVAALSVNLTGSGNAVVVTEQNDLTIFGANGVRTNNGNVSITTGNAARGNLSLNAPISAGTANVALTANGAVNTGSVAGVVSGNVLNVAVQNTSSISTNVTSVVGTISGAGQTLTINEQNGLQIGAANLAATGGAGIAVNVANGALNGSGNITSANGPISVTLGNGPLNMTGALNAGTDGNLTLSVNGTVSMTGANQIVGNVLSLTSSGNAAINTALKSLVANITGANASLAITDTDALAVGMNGVRTKNGNISLASGKDSVGNLTLYGFVDAGFSNATLSANGVIGGIGVVSANVLNLAPTNGATLNTSVNALVANVTGTGPLVITESNDLAVSGNNIRTANGDILITLATGSLGGNGGINAGTGNVTLNASQGNVTLNAVDGQIRGNVLNVTAKANTALNTNVNTLIANITGTGSTLTVNEVNNLTAIGNNVRTANGDVSITLATGSLGGSGSIVAGSGNVTLNASQGSVTLNAVAGQISGNVLNVTANGSTALNTNVNTLITNITGLGSTLTVNEVNNLTAIGQNVATNNGDIAINLVSGSLGGNGSILAGNGNVSIGAANGNITLNAVPSQVVANVLSTTSKGDTLLNTRATSLNSLVTSSGNLTVVEADNLNINSAQTTNGAVTITTNNASTLNVFSINAAVGSSGKIGRAHV